MPGVSHRDVLVDGVRLHVAEAGDGPPLVLLHGWPQHWWCWRHLIPQLARDYRVIVPDLRGWGWSDAPEGHYDKATFVKDVLGLLDAEGLERVRLMGHDWGGYTAFLLALEQPSRIERMVALDIPPPFGLRPRLRPEMLLIVSYQLLLAAPGLGAGAMTSNRHFIPTIIRRGSGRGATWTDEELEVYSEVLREPARARATSACYRTFLTRELPLRDRGVTELEVPTLLLMGEASALRRALDPQPTVNLQVEQIPGAGHFLPEEAPDEVLERARPFLVAS